MRNRLRYWTRLVGYLWVSPDFTCDFMPFLDMCKFDDDPIKMNVPGGGQVLKCTVFAIQLEKSDLVGV